MGVKNRLTELKIPLSFWECSLKISMFLLNPLYIIKLNKGEKGTWVYFEKRSSIITRVWSLERVLAKA